MKSDRITMERLYDASPRELWDLWTTKEGIESWWGPEGFRVEVRKIDLRPGGDLLYDMIAASPDMIAFMRQAGAPTSTPARAKYVEVVPERRLAYDHLVDFVPGVKPYNVSYELDIQPAKHGTQVRLSFDPLHDKEWSWRQRAGWEQELTKLSAAVQARHS